MMACSPGALRKGFVGGPKHGSDWQALQEPYPAVEALLLATWFKDFSVPWRFGSREQCLLGKLGYRVCPVAGLSCVLIFSFCICTCLAALKLQRSPLKCCRAYILFGKLFAFGSCSAEVLGWYSGEALRSPFSSYPLSLAEPPRFPALGEEAEGLSRPRVNAESMVISRAFEDAAGFAKRLNEWAKALRRWFEGGLDWDPKAWQARYV